MHFNKSYLWLGKECSILPFADVFLCVFKSTFTTAYHIHIPLRACLWIRKDLEDKQLCPTELLVFQTETAQGTSNQCCSIPPNPAGVLNVQPHVWFIVTGQLVLLSSLIFWSLSGTLRNTSFNIYKFYVVITFRLCVLRTNSDFCLAQH